ncbi:hypothetical protein O3P69_006780 [Scylla paramamosain]|uniref:F5/8 type C domain-containing protein n=1 Tax=Scylla paramamosain TaxID=85552 RepID=A0AAW0U2C4_SCYPA
MYMNSTGPISLCLPVRVYLPDTYLKLPDAYYNECRLYNFVITSGYSMTAQHINARPLYRALKYKNLYTYPDLALNASVTSDSDRWISPTFQSHMTNGALCTTELCPCTSSPGHYVTVDLGKMLFIKSVLVTVGRIQKEEYSQNFYGYIGDTENRKRNRYTFGSLSPGTNRYNMKVEKEIQFISFTKPDNYLCLCFLQAFSQ